MSTIWQEHQIEKDLDRRWALHIAKQYPILQQTKRLESRNKRKDWDIPLLMAGVLICGVTILAWLVVWLRPWGWVGL